MSATQSILLATVLSAHPLVNEEILEPSIRNEVDHALATASTNAVAESVAGRCFAELFRTNGMNATQRAIALVSSQRQGCWYWMGTNVTPVAVTLLRRAAGSAVPDRAQP